MYNKFIRIHSNMCLRTTNPHPTIMDLHSLSKSTFIPLGYANIYVQRPRIRTHAHQVGAGLHRTCEISLHFSFHCCYYQLTNLVVYCLILWLSIQIHAFRNSENCKNLWQLVLQEKTKVWMRVLSLENKKGSKP
jgi:hypothetical protein